MRSVVIDHVREQQSAKRGGGEVMVTLTTDIQGEVLEDERLLAINTALDALERIAPAYRELIEMRYFVGLTLREVAEVRGVSTRTVEREWDKARASSCADERGLTTWPPVRARMRRRSRRWAAKRPRASPRCSTRRSICRPSSAPPGWPSVRSPSRVWRPSSPACWRPPWRPRQASQRRHS